MSVLKSITLPDVYLCGPFGGNLHDYFFCLPINDLNKAWLAPALSHVHLQFNAPFSVRVLESDINLLKHWCCVNKLR